ncbi:hypothetical protein MKW92_043234 [Papaver armeniacum]|nr:hypothetical protein MKW92_043234 [Papaver armeniacum]
MIYLFFFHSYYVSLLWDLHVCRTIGEDKEEVEPVAGVMKMSKSQRARNQRALQIRCAMF